MPLVESCSLKLALGTTRIPGALLADALCSSNTSSLCSYREQNKLRCTRPTNAPLLVIEGTSVRATRMYSFPTSTYHSLLCRVFISRWQFLANMPTP